MKHTKQHLLFAAFMACALIAPPALATDDLEQAFDKVFGAQPAARPAPAPAAPVAALPVGPASSFEARLAGLANAAHGRIGVAALDLSTGSGVSVMGDQPFPMASTVKVAIVATFLEGVDQGRFRLTDRFPLMIPVPSRKFSSSVAPVHAGQALSALELIELAITRSDNRATDALLAAIGGPQAVDRWLHRAKIGGIHVNRDIATLVRDDGGVDPATTIDLRDSATPQAMATLLAGLYQGQWLSMASREVLLGAMSRCLTGVHRMKALVPDEAIIGHKTGTLSNTSSDVGFIRTADGHTVALAIYVTGQGSRPGRESRIATIARAVYDNFSDPAQGGSRVSLN